MFEYLDWVRRGGYYMAQAIADTLKSSFFQNASPGALGFLGVGLALPFRQIAIWSNPDDFIEVEGQVEPKAVAEKITVLFWNILGFHTGQAANEGRPHWSQVIGDNGERRIDKICQQIIEIDPDVVMLSESHGGTELERKELVAKLQDHYGTFYTDILPKALMFGSGNFVATKYKNTSLQAYEFVAKGGNDAKFVRKGFAVLSIRDDDDKLVARIAGTHLQSGHSSDKPDGDAGSTNAQIRNAQALEIKAKLEELNASEPAKVNIFGGDCNANRRDDDDMMINGEMALLNPENPALKNGFGEKLDANEPTQIDLPFLTEEWKTENPNKDPWEAVDTIVGLPSDSYTLVTEGVSDYKDVNDPSDHMALKGTITLTA